MSSESSDGCRRDVEESEWACALPCSDLVKRFKRGSVEWSEDEACLWRCDIDWKEESLAWLDDAGDWSEERRRLGGREREGDAEWEGCSIHKLVCATQKQRPTFTDEAEGVEDFCRGWNAATGECVDVAGEYRDVGEREGVETRKADIHRQAIG